MQPLIVLNAIIDKELRSNNLKISCQNLNVAYPKVIADIRIWSGDYLLYP